MFSSVQAVSRAVNDVNTHRPRFQGTSTASYTASYKNTDTDSGSTTSAARSRERATVCDTVRAAGGRVGKAG